MHDLLEAHGLPVPHAYGLCDEPYALVMDRLSGFVDLAGATDDAERDRVLEEYLEVLARIYAIPLDAAAAAGFAVPTDSATTELSFLRRDGGPATTSGRKGIRPTRWRCSCDAGCASTCRRIGSPTRASSPTTPSSSCSTRAASPGCSTSSTRTWAIR